jgi:hypothetical protein
MGKILYISLHYLAQGERQGGEVAFRGGHRHRQVGRMPDTDLIPDLRSKGVKYRFFCEKPKAKIMPFTAIVFDR